MSEDRAVARVLRWVRVVTIGMLVLLGATVWREAWPVDGVEVGPAVLVISLWLLGTNVWSLRHDRGLPGADGTTVEVCSDVGLALVMTVLGGPLVTDTLPLLGVLVVIEASVRLSRRPAAAITATYVAVSILTITLRWPAWVGWSGRDVLTDLLPAAVALPIAHLLVAHLATDRAQTRDVALGQARRLAMVARDLRAANARLAGTNEELTAFAGRIAHDLRSPLGTVVTALETLQRPELDLPVDTREFLVTQSLRAARRSVAIVGALLDHASAEGRAPEVALVDVGEVAAEVVATLPAEMLGTVHLDLPPGPALAWADAQLLPLVLQNLVTNALAHGGERARPHRGDHVDRGRGRRGDRRRRRRRDPRGAAGRRVHGRHGRRGRTGTGARAGDLPLDRAPPRWPHLDRGQRHGRRRGVLRAAVARRGGPAGAPPGPPGRAEHAGTTCAAGRRPRRGPGRSAHAGHQQQLGVVEGHLGGVVPAGLRPRDASDLQPRVLGHAHQPRDGVGGGPQVEACPRVVGAADLADLVVHQRHRVEGVTRRRGGGRRTARGRP